MKYILFGVGIWCSMLVVTGCQSDPVTDTPPEIRYGEDICDQCRMIISEPRFAAAYVSRTGETGRFDDIGDLVLFSLGQAEEVTIFWVHDYDTQEWLKADQAFFVLSKNLHTPMEHGVAAFRTESRAREFATEREGIVLRYKELQTRIASRAAASAQRELHRHQQPHGQKTIPVEKRY